MTVAQEPVKEDWAAQFFEHCQDVSDEQMQVVWSKILAGEVAQPCSFSMRTLHAVKMLRSGDANTFTAYCRFLWSACDPTLSFFIEPANDARWSIQAASQITDFYASHGINRWTACTLNRST